MFTNNPPRLVNSLEDRIRLLHRYGMEEVKVYPVTEEVMSTPWEMFLDDLVSLGAAGFVCGSDYRFGSRGEGTAEKLKDYCIAHGLSCGVVGDRMLDGIRISSTHIRSLLEAGDMEGASRFLGHPHMLSGEVVSGRKLGRTIGVPTANLQLPEDAAVLPHGVYACKAQVEQRTYLAVTNIGSRPTVGGHRVTIEPWILDFDGNLYEKTLVLEFYQFLRPERKFDSLEELKMEIQKNALQTRKIFEKT
jgi:riboflavin kinase/FMN adenylyltransferase